MFTLALENWKHDEELMSKLVKLLHGTLLNFYNHVVIFTLLRFQMKAVLYRKIVCLRYILGF